MTAKQIKALRTRTSLSQQDFASLLGVSFVSLNRWENAHAKATDLSLVLLTLVHRAMQAHPPTEVVQRIRGAGTVPVDLLRELYRMEAKP